MKKIVFVDLVCSMLVFLFIYTGLLKAINRDVFETQMLKSPFITNYARALSWLVPYQELSVVGLLLFKATRKWGLYLSFTLLTLFTEYIIGMLRYSPFLPCSCGGIVSKLSWTGHSILNGGLLLLTILAIYFLEIPFVSENKFKRTKRDSDIALSTNIST